MRTRGILTEEEQRKVVEAIRRAECGTSGEIVPMVLERAHAYTYLDFLGGLFGLALSSLIGTWFLPSCHYLPVFSLQTLGYLAGFLAFRHLPWLKRPFLSRQRVDEEVFERALSVFRDLELERTRDRTGVLILVCLLEHRVQVLTDTGINARVGPGTWDEVVGIVLSGIRQGDLSTGLAKAIERCGEILAPHFPARTDDTNELPDQVLTD